MDLQKEVNGILHSLNLKAWKIHRGKEQNPFPINSKYVYKVSRGQQIGKFAKAVLIEFINEYKNLNNENN